MENSKSVSLSPIALKSLYDGSTASLTQQTNEVKNLFKRITKVMGPQFLEDMLFMEDEPLGMLLEIFVEKDCFTPKCSVKNDSKTPTKLRKKLFSKTPPSAKKTKQIGEFVTGVIVSPGGKTTTATGEVTKPTKIHEIVYLD